MSQTTQYERPEPADAQQSGRQPRFFRTAVDLPEETRRPVVRQLNRTLADTTDLQTQMKFAHWNVKGMNFYQLHLLFDEIAEVLEDHADTLAERATTLGGQAMGTVRMAAANSGIPELSPETVTGPAFVEETTEHLAVHAANLRSAIDFAAGYGDEDTADLYTELSREVDQQLYFLESHLQGPAAGAVERARDAQAAGDAHQPAWSLQDSGTARQAPQRTTFTGTPQQQRQQGQGSQSRQGQGGRYQQPTQ